MMLAIASRHPAYNGRCAIGNLMVRSKAIKAKSL
jgi:hypothetical protein